MVARLAGKGIIEANMTPALLRLDPQAIAHMDEVALTVHRRSMSL